MAFISPSYQFVLFEITHSIQFGQSVYVYGSWNNWTSFIKLHWTCGDVWRGSVVVPCAKSEFKFAIGPTEQCDSCSFTWECTPNRVLVLPTTLENSSWVINTLWESTLPLEYKERLPTISYEVVIAKPGFETKLNRHAFMDVHVGPRYVDVLLPPSLLSSSRPTSGRFPVLYFHDGQNVFDPATCESTHIDWGVHEALREHNFPEVIVVAVWTTPDRIREYSPKLEEKSKAKGNKYLRFLVDRVKPMIDSSYPTLIDAKNTYLIGSSMGGLISLHGICVYPLVFGGAACLSIHLPASGAKLLFYLEEHPEIIPERSKLYLDCGTIELDQYYPYLLHRLRDIIQQRGYQIGDQNTILQGTPISGNTAIVAVYQGEGHTEAAWRRRVWIPLKYLLS